MGQLLSILPTAVVLTAALIAGVTDLMRFRVHNLLTLPLLFSGLIYHAAVGGVPGFVESVFGAVIGFTVLFLFYLMGGMGAGDVKLLAGIGAWVGMPLTIYVFLASALAAGIYAIVLIIACGKVRETWVNLQILWYRFTALGRHLTAEDNVEVGVTRDDRRRRFIPFAAMVAVGVVAILLWSWLIGTE